MSKRKLSQQQKRIIEQHQLSALHNHSEAIQSVNGLLVAHYGTYADIELNDQQLIRCNLRQNLNQLVVGDQVVLELKNEQEGVILACKPRQNVLQRTDPRGQTKIVAANVDQIMVVIAIKPEFSFYLLDCYIAAAEIQKINPVIVFNKIDLLSEQEQNILKELQYYQSLGYPLILVSSIENRNLVDLENQLRQHCSVFVGQSGVGKSSLIQHFVAEKVEVGNISEQNKLGKHTTTTSRLYHLPHGGDLIDSPGVREFGLGKIDRQQLNDGFIDIKKIAHGCKFRNCTHQHEPNCAVKLAVIEKIIPNTRLENFHKLLGMINE